ncbi:MAG: sugar transferase, partial [Myxococcales bacterium]|nr:sugar transferase [Myxococcales bacterium]
LAPERPARRLALDVWYVDNWNVALDAKIIAMTIKQALFGSGVLSGQNVDDVDDLGLAPKTLDSTSNGGA